MTDAAEEIIAPSSKKPRVLLLGEFSAGKSTLANILLGSAQSPVRVTATQMPPICYVSGVGQPMRVASDGEEIPVDLADVPRLPLEATQFIRIPFNAPLLDQIDLFDMPGSSDPNMSTDFWNDLLPLADIVLWCTPATQAWRQTEAAIWDTVSSATQNRSLLLLTRIDKIDSASDRDRVMARVTQETRDLFRLVLPVSLVGTEGQPVDGVSPDMAAFFAAFQDVISNPEVLAPAKQVPVMEEQSPAKETVQSTSPRMSKVLPRRVSTLDVSAARPRARRQHAGDRLI